MTHILSPQNRNLLCFVIPYFGRLPGTMRVFLNTIKYNPDYNWLLFTDDHYEYDYPENIIVKYCSFSEIREKIQNCFDFKISLEKPFKLCDYKPAYGYIFKEELANFDFWGYCDTDQFFGDLSKWLTKEYLNRFDKIFGLGHMTIYRNSHEMNTLFMNEDQRQNLIFNHFSQIFQSPENHAFDEMLPNKVNINHLAKQAGIRQSNDCFAADIAPYSSLFTQSYFYADEFKWDSNETPVIILWNKGKLYTVDCNSGTLEKKEVLYAHIQKRKLKLVDYNSEFTFFIIVPNKIVFNHEGFTDTQLLNEIKRMKKRRKFKIDEINHWMKTKQRLYYHRMNKIRNIAFTSRNKQK